MICEVCCKDIPHGGVRVERFYQRKVCIACDNHLEELDKNNFFNIICPYCGDFLNDINKCRKCGRSLLFREFLEFTKGGITKIQLKMKRNEIVSRN